MKRLVASVAAAILVVLSTTGCIKLNMDLKVSSNDTMNGTVTLAMSKALVDYAKSSGGNTDSLQGNNLFAKQPGVTVKTYSDGTFEGTSYIFKNLPLKKFSPSNKSTSLSILRKGDNIIVSGDLDSSGGQANLEEAKTNPFTKAFFAGSEVRISITLPGEIKSSNGAQKGNKITWTGQLGDKMTFKAVAYSPQGISPIILWSAAGGALLIIAIVVTLLILKNRKKSVSVTTD